MALRSFWALRASFSSCFCIWVMYWITLIETIISIVTLTLFQPYWSLDFMDWYMTRVEQKNEGSKLMRKFIHRKNGLKK